MGRWGEEERERGREGAKESEMLSVFPPAIMLNLNMFAPEGIER